MWVRVDADRVGFGDDWRTAYSGGTKVQLVGRCQEKTSRTSKTKQQIPSLPPPVDVGEAKRARTRFCLDVGWRYLVSKDGDMAGLHGRSRLEHYPEAKLWLLKMPVVSVPFWAAGRLVTSVCGSCESE